MNRYSLSRFALFSKENGAQTDNALVIANGLIESIGNATAQTDFDCEGLIALPAFVNAHDHLLAAFSPKIGHGPYASVDEWDLDVKQSAPYAERARIALDDIYRLGALKNFISGTLTVADHIPREALPALKDELPITIIDRYALAYSATSRALQWGEGIEKEHARAVREGVPFFIHAAEDPSDRAKNAIKTLAALGALTKETVLIGCVGLSQEDIETIAASGAAVALTPESDWYLYTRVAPIDALLRANVRLALTTDGAHAGSSSIIEAIHFAKKIYERNGRARSYDILLTMATLSAADILMQNNRGRIEKNRIADILFFTKNDFPYTMSAKDIALIIRNGVPVYADKRFKNLLSAFHESIFEAKAYGVTKYAAYDIRRTLQRARKTLGYSKEFAFLPIE